MRCLLTGIAVALLFAGEACAVSTIIEVTPKDAKSSGIAFDVSCKERKDGTVKFRIEVSENGSKFSSKPAMNLSRVQRSENSESITSSKVKVKSKRKNGSFVCKFTVPKEKLKDPEFCFVFTNFVEQVIDGKVVPRPAATFYCVRLGRFWEASGK